MKFVCNTCESYMTFEGVELLDEGSLGVSFTCPSCNRGVSMVTNRGETQLVSSLGVTLGGRTAPAQPLEVTRQSMEQPAGGEAPSGRPSAAATSSGGGCPFSSMLGQMGFGGEDGGTAGPELAWTEGASAQLARLPEPVAGLLARRAERHARQAGLDAVTEQVLAEVKSSGIPWSPDAEQRLGNIPESLRPMIKLEIERLARERGQDTVTVELMDLAKQRFAMS